MTLAAGGIQLALSSSGSPLSLDQFLTLNGLSSAVVRYLQTQSEIATGVLRVTFPAAKRLIRELRQPTFTERVQLEVEAIEALKPYSVPPNFRVEWSVDVERHVLLRHLIGADDYLGGGCFYRSEAVWRVETAFSPEMWACLERHELPADEWGAWLQAELAAHPSPYFQ